MILSGLVEGGVGTGWTIYPPLSRGEYHPTPAIDIVAFALHVAGFRSIMGSLNFLSTLVRARFFALIPERLPVFC